MKKSIGLFFSSLSLLSLGVLSFPIAKAFAIGGAFLIPAVAGAQLCWSGAGIILGFAAGPVGWGAVLGVGV